MNPYIVIAGIIGSVALGFKLGSDHEVAAQARSKEHIEQAIKAATETSAKALAEVKPKYTTINNKVQHEVETRAVYRECKLDQITFDLLNEALASPSGRMAAPAVSEHRPSGDVLR